MNKNEKKCNIFYGNAYMVIYFTQYILWNSSDQSTGVGSLSLLQGIFPTLGSSPGLPHCRRILYQLSHNESPRIQEGVGYPFSSRSSWPRNQTRVSCRQILYQVSYQGSPSITQSDNIYYIPGMLEIWMECNEMCQHSSV